MYGRLAWLSEFGRAEVLLGSMAPGLEGLQAHRFGLSDCQRAFGTAADKRSRALKVTVPCRRGRGGREGGNMVETRGLEPLTSAMRTLRSPR